MPDSDTTQMLLPFEAPERWLDVVGFEGFYLVSDLGRVRSLPRKTVRGMLGGGRGRGGSILRQSSGWQKCPRVKLTRDNVSRRYLVRLLVADAFLGPPPPDLCVRHKDGIETDCRLANLEFGRPGEGAQDPLGVSERWLPIPGLEGRYEVSNYGRVMSVPRETIQGKWVGGLMAGGLDSDGYRVVTLYRSGVGTTRKVHQLVMLAFVGPPQLGQEVRHLDGNPFNNRWEPGDEAETRAAGGNLYYGTTAENQHDRVQHETSTRGIQNGRAKLTEDDVREIRRRSAGGETRVALGLEFGVAAGVISQAVHRKTWRHVA